MTLRQLYREFVAAMERRTDQRDRDLYMAWHVEALSRQKKMPTLESLLRKKSSAAQSVSQMRDVLATLSKQYGIPLKQVAHG
jgi:hypothetical protein